MSLLICLVCRKRSQPGTKKNNHNINRAHGKHNAVLHHGGTDHGCTAGTRDYKISSLYFIYSHLKELSSIELFTETLFFTFDTKDT